MWRRRLRWRLYCVFLTGQGDLGCEVNGITYREGQSFQPSCDSYCHCRGGGVSCVPACPLDFRRPTPDCPNPQHIRLPGKCCKEWVCENLENTVIQDAITGKLYMWIDELRGGKHQTTSNAGLNLCCKVDFFLAAAVKYSWTFMVDSKGRHFRKYPYSLIDRTLMFVGKYETTSSSINTGNRGKQLAKKSLSQLQMLLIDDRSIWQHNSAFIYMRFVTGHVWKFLLERFCIKLGCVWPKENSQSPNITHISLEKSRHISFPSHQVS